MGNKSKGEGSLPTMGEDITGTEFSPYSSSESVLRDGFPHQEEINIESRRLSEVANEYENEIRDFDITDEQKEDNRAIIDSINKTNELLTNIDESESNYQEYVEQRNKTIDLINSRYEKSYARWWDDNEYFSNIAYYVQDGLGTPL